MCARVCIHVCIVLVCIYACMCGFIIQGFCCFSQPLVLILIILIQTKDFAIGRFLPTADMGEDRALLLVPLLEII